MEVKNTWHRMVDNDHQTIWRTNPGNPRDPAVFNNTKSISLTRYENERRKRYYVTLIIRPMTTTGQYLESKYSKDFATKKEALDHVSFIKKELDQYKSEVRKAKRYAAAKNRIIGLPTGKQRYF